MSKKYKILRFFATVSIELEERFGIIFDSLSQETEVKVSMLNHQSL